MTFIQAAQLILRAQGRPTTWRKIAELAVRHELLSHVGTAPAETMKTRLDDVVRRLKDDGPFVETRSGTFALRAWGGGSPGPEPEAVAEIETHQEAAARAVVAAAKPAPAAEKIAGRGRGRGRKTEAQGKGEKNRGPAEMQGKKAEGEGVERKDGVEGEVPEERAKIDGSTETTPVEGEAREPRGRRRRRGKRRSGARETAADTAAAAPVPDRAGVPPSAPPPPAPAPASPAPPAAPEPDRCLEAVLRALRGSRGRRPLRPAEILQEWKGRGGPESRFSRAELLAALALGDAAQRAGAPVVSLPGSRWAPADWLLGDDAAALERKAVEATERHRAVVGRLLLKRLAEMPAADFQTIAAALLRAEGFRELRPLDRPPAGPGLLLRGRRPYGPAEVDAIVLVLQLPPNRFVPEDQIAGLRGLLPRAGAGSGVIVTTGRVGELAHRDLAPPNAVPLLALEQDALVERLVLHRIGIRFRTLELSLPDPELFRLLPDDGNG
jgi:hypothetical protein